MDQQALYVVADCSGSMAEPGKTAVLASLVSYVRTCERLGTLPAWCSQVKLVAWSDQARLLELALQAPLPALTCGGRAESATLFALLMQDGARTARILLLSDGGIDPVGQRAWQTWRAGYAGGAPELRAIAVGADATLPALEVLVGKGRLFAAEDIGVALHDWAAHQEAPQADPWCLADTVQAASIETDDWA
ncbi:hypothetical protein LQ564_00130 [Massilia sp. G4R7]|uniref:VWA domain-containing protein n=1 Tax=Massilia phyllostachyos TaxID=2898585 RepID=A0ABS8PYY2_9BURK|nr:hypothetical protein [Massilia phyllostachyos]MCD2514716.1 hypothetical protein [Massilia phyllostachyos]